MWHNESWAYAIIDCLVQLGVRHFALSPGSRSTPLALAIARHPYTTVKIHYDERALGFYALGYAKAKHIPCPIIVTSGTAVGNLLPSVMEAYHANIPMLLLTADRPPELLECSANQTSKQSAIFANFVRWKTTLPTPAPNLSGSFLSSTIAYALQHTMLVPSGPVHVNCMFREPLFTKEPWEVPKLTAPIYNIPQVVSSPETIVDFLQRVAQVERGVIVAGAHSHYANEAVLHFAKTLNWPIFADILSPLRSLGRRQEVIAFHDTLIEAGKVEAPDFILRIGDRIVSKTLSQWLSQSKQESWQIVEHPLRADPEYAATQRVTSNLNDFFSACQDFIAPILENAWTQRLKDHSERVGTLYADYFKDRETLCEQEPFYHLDLPSHWAMFLSNSLPIRHAQRYYFPHSKMNGVYANRGQSGIDGNLATAVGIAEGLKTPLIAILGDLAMLHDINSFSLLKKSTVPVIAVVINNDGGGIFSYLPISEKKEICEEYFATPHGLTLSKHAEAFEIKTLTIRTKDEWTASLDELLKNPQNCLVEILCARQDTAKTHEELSSQILDGLCSLIH